eukprot:scaffold306_cov525-Prasinococcus_capsulatus_cf.AAC.52
MPAAQPSAESGAGRHAFGQRGCTLRHRAYLAKRAISPIRKCEAEQSGYAPRRSNGKDSPRLSSLRRLAAASASDRCNGADRRPSRRGSQADACSSWARAGARAIGSPQPVYQPARDACGPRLACLPPRSTASPTGQLAACARRRRRRGSSSAAALRRCRACGKGLRQQLATAATWRQGRWRAVR